MLPDLKNNGSERLAQPEQLGFKCFLTLIDLVSHNLAFPHFKGLPLAEFREELQSFNLIVGIAFC